MEIFFKIFNTGRFCAFSNLLRLGHLFNTQDVCVVETGLDVVQSWIRVSGSSFLSGRDWTFCQGSIFVRYHKINMQ